MLAQTGTEFALFSVGLASEPWMYTGRAFSSKEIFIHKYDFNDVSSLLN